MTTSKAFTQPSSVATAVSLAVAVVACFVLFAVTDRTVSPSFAEVCERDDKENALAVNLGDPCERAGGDTLQGAARRVPPAPQAGATLEGISPMLDPTTGLPAVVPNAPDGVSGPPGAAHGARKAELAPSGADGPDVPLAPVRPKIGDTRPAPLAAKEPEASPQPGNGRGSQAAASRQREGQRGER